jgi:hypothetical protein
MQSNYNLSEKLTRKLMSIQCEVIRHFQRAMDRGFSPGQLPLDPLKWDRDQVQQWLTISAAKYRIRHVDLRKFRMNGRALCLVSPSGFEARVPDSGSMLYSELCLRLQQAATLRNARINYY